VRKVVTFETKGANNSFSSVLGNTTRSYVGQGVKVSAVHEDTETEMNMVYDPSHPDADENGYVTYPNVNIITEMTNLIDASRSYEANATAFNASKSMAAKGLEIGN
jgi:flagellar basal-body rod protein FlgC